MNLQQFLLTLRARYKIGILVLVLVIAGMAVYTAQLPKKYDASTSVLLDIKAPDPLIGTDSPALTMNSYMPTQVQIISSNRVAQKVVEQLQLDKNPAIRTQWFRETKGKGKLIAWLGALLKLGLKVEPSADSNIINITFSSKDPAFAATLANAFAQAYIDTNLELKVDPARQYAAWFQERVKGLRADLEKAQARLVEYQQKTGIVIADDLQPSSNREKITQLAGELSMTEGKSADLQSKQMYASSADTMPDIMQNPIIQTIKEQIITKEVKLRELGQTMGKNNPQYLAVQDQIASLKQQLKDESRQIMDSFNTANRVNKQRANELKAAIESHKKQTMEDMGQRNQLEVLQNDVQAAQKAYDLVMQHYVESNLQSQSNQTNISILTPAAEPTEPSSPKVLKNMLISVFLGIVGGIGAIIALEILDYRVRTTETLGTATGVPVMIHFTPNPEPVDVKGWIIKFVDRARFRFKPKMKAG